MSCPLPVTYVLSPHPAFYEGSIVTGYPSDATEEAVQASIVAAGYGK